MAGHVLQVPDTGRLGGILDGARLLYMGESEKLLSVYKPLGAENPLTYAYWCVASRPLTWLQAGMLICCCTHNSNVNWLWSML